MPTFIANPSLGPQVPNVQRNSAGGARPARPASDGRHLYPAPKDYRDNGADTRRLAEDFKLRCNSSLSIEDLANLGAEKLLELLNKPGTPAVPTAGNAATRPAQQREKVQKLARLFADHRQAHEGQGTGS